MKKTLPSAMRAPPFPAPRLGVWAPASVFMNVHLEKHGFRWSCNRLLGPKAKPTCPQGTEFFCIQECFPLYFHWESNSETSWSGETDLCGARSQVDVGLWGAGNELWGGRACGKFWEASGRLSRQPRIPESMFRGLWPVYVQTAELLWSLWIHFKTSVINTQNTWG